MHLKEVYRNNAAAVDTLLREKMTALQIPGITAVSYTHLPKRR